MGGGMMGGMMGMAPMAAAWMTNTEAEWARCPDIRIWRRQLRHGSGWDTEAKGTVRWLGGGQRHRPPRSACTTKYDVPVEVYGIIYIYNPVDRNKLGETGADTDGNDSRWRRRRPVEDRHGTGIRHISIAGPVGLEWLHGRESDEVENRVWRRRHQRILCAARRENDLWRRDPAGGVLRLLQRHAGRHLAERDAGEVEDEAQSARGHVTSTTGRVGTGTRQESGRLSHSCRRDPHGHPRRSIRPRPALAGTGC
jgi:hypothetical protein